MFDIDAFLDRAKAGAGVASDYALAVKVLGYPKSTTVSNWRTGRSAPDGRAIVALCQLSGDDPEHVAACIQAMRAANDEEAELWRRVAARVASAGGTAAAVLVAFAVLAILAPAPALADAGAGLCVMSNAILARLLWRVAAAAARQRRLPCQALQVGARSPAGSAAVA